MTAAAPAMAPMTVDLGEADRRNLRSARIRGIVIAALGVFAFRAAVGSFDVPATFSFWVVKQGGAALRHESGPDQKVAVAVHEENG